MRARGLICLLISCGGQAIGPADAGKEATGAPDARVDPPGVGLILPPPEPDPMMPLDGVTLGTDGGAAKKTFKPRE